MVLSDQACRVLHGHAVTGKRHHAGAQLDMQCVQRGGEQVGSSGHKNSKGNEKPQHLLWRLPSLSALPERFAGNVQPKSQTFCGLLLRWMPWIDVPAPLSSEVTPLIKRFVSPFA
jgi:hypothetical protein